VAHNVGDAMTFKIFTEDTQKNVFCSVLCPGKDDRFQNTKRVHFEPNPEESDDPSTPDTMLTYAPRCLKIDHGLSKQKKANKCVINNAVLAPFLLLIWSSIMLN
jgi:hypothetical protein